MDVLAQIRQTILQYDLIPSGETVIVGVSGGPDSLCLLHALTALRAELGCGLHIAHLNHQLRGADADADAQFVSDLAARWQLPCSIGTRDVAALARTAKLSIEEAARQARYAFLAEVAAAHGSQTIAVAHNADDQAESVLMHFLRGSGTAGLRGMLPISDFGLRISDPSFVLRPSSLKLIRPLLTVSRSEVERYCREHDLQPRFDTSNLDTTFFRNRLRHELLPLLETYNPNIREVLLRTAEVIAAEVETLRGATDQAWQATTLSESDSAITFNLGAWRGLPLAMRRATLREAIRRLRPSLRNINFVHVENAVAQLQHGPTGVRVTLPQGLMLTIGYQSFTITASARVIDLPDWPLLADDARLTITVPGTIRLPASDWILETTCLDRWSDQVFVNSDPWTAYLDGDVASPSLSIRARQAGDVFHPQGMPTSTRLTDWMTNAKILQRARDRLPLIIAGDRIAWVAGFRVGQPFIITPNTRRVLKLSFRRLADSPAR